MAKIEDLSEYVTKAPTDLQTRFAEWCTGDEVGADPSACKNKQEAFELGIKLGTSLRIVFQKSAANQSVRAAAAEAREAAAAERLAKKSNKKKGKPEDAPVVESDDDDDEDEAEAEAPAPKAKKAKAEKAKPAAKAKKAKAKPAAADEDDDEDEF